MILSVRSKNLITKTQEMNDLLNCTNVQYANPWLRSAHRNGIPLFAKLKQVCRNRWLSRPQLSESVSHDCLVAVLKTLSKSYIEHVSTSCVPSNSETQNAFSLPVKDT